MLGYPAIIHGVWDHPSNLIGIYVITSKVIKIDDDRKGFETENTRYEIGKAFDTTSSNTSQKEQV